MTWQTIETGICEYCSEITDYGDDMCVICAIRYDDMGPMQRHLFDHDVTVFECYECGEEVALHVLSETDTQLLCPLCYPNEGSGIDG